MIALYTARADSVNDEKMSARKYSRRSNVWRPRRDWKRGEQLLVVPASKWIHGAGTCFLLVGLVWLLPWKCGVARRCLFVSIFRQREGKMKIGNNSRSYADLPIMDSSFHPKNPSIIFPYFHKTFRLFVLKIMNRSLNSKTHLRY